VRLDTVVENRGGQKVGPRTYLNGYGSLMSHLPVSFLSAMADQERKAEMLRYCEESYRNIARRSIDTLPASLRRC